MTMNRYNVHFASEFNKMYIITDCKVLKSDFQGFMKFKDKNGKEFYFNRDRIFIIDKIKREKKRRNRYGTRN